MSGRYRIAVHGCDDSTEIVAVLTESEAATVRMVADMITKASTYGCEPVMEIHAHPDQEEDDLG